MPRIAVGGFCTRPTRLRRRKRPIADFVYGGGWPPMAHGMGRVLKVFFSIVAFSLRDNISLIRRFRTSATKIYERVDWPWMLNGGPSFSMGWHPRPASSTDDGVTIAS